MERANYVADDLFHRAADDLASRFEKEAEKVTEKPSDWIEKNFWVPTPRNPVTGEVLTTGPIILADHQRAILNEALSKNEKGEYKYATIVYSAPKKSGKSATASAVGLYIAAHTPFGQIYVLANDGKNSKDRLYGPIFRCLHFHRQKQLSLGKTKINLTEAILPNNAKIEALPVDPSGEAGGEPSAVFFSEIWGYDSEAKRRLFTEMTIPSTLWGRAIRWIETYAGYQGQSDLLWELYQKATKEGYPHPDFEYLKGRKGEPVVWVNDKARMFCYWDSAARMPWQVPEYYEAEAQVLTSAEFDRLHYNEWVSSVGSFIHSSWWDACQDANLPYLIEGGDVPVVLAVDAALTGDCASIVAVSRDPYLPDTDVAVRYCKVWKASPKKPIQIEADIGREIRRLSRMYNVICVAYDAYQMEGLAQNYRQGKVTLTAEEKEGRTEEELAIYLKQEETAAQLWYYQFGQQNPRAIADKKLQDMVKERRIHWNPHDLNSDIAERGHEETLTKHIKQAGSKSNGNQLRIVKLSDDSKIDGAVALSMAVDRCLTMNLDNRELHLEDLMRQYQRGKITYQQYLERIEQRNVAHRIT